MGAFNVTFEEDKGSLLKVVLKLVIEEYFSAHPYEKISEEELAAALNAYLAEHPIDSVDVNEVNAIIAQYLENHPIATLTTNDVNNIVALYMQNHPVDTLSATDVNNIISRYMADHPITTVDASQVQSIVAEYIRNHPTQTLTEEQVGTIIAEYLQEHPIDAMSEQEVQTIVADYLEEHPIEGDNANEVITRINVVLFDAYSNSNSRTTNLGAMPFILTKNNVGDCYVTSLQINIATVGTLSIGKVEKNKCVVDEAFNLSDVTIIDTIEFTSTGENTYEFSEPLQLKADEYLTIGYPNDTVQFLYGDNGTDKGFYYINNDTLLCIYNPRPIGVTVNVYYEEKQTKIKSFYDGKTLSILGDSISTYDGYIPNGNLTYYPKGTVTSVTDTWWNKLINKLGMILDTNNSWSGSRVTTTNGEESAGCMSRCQNLGDNPNVIIVYMGINDFNDDVALGTYDGTTELPTVTTTFREAYAIMLNKLLTEYQTSEVWVCTLPQCERNKGQNFPEINDNDVSLAEYNKAIRELADAFGVRVLEHSKCGLTYQNMPIYNPDNLHPTKEGHTLMANNDVWQMTGIRS